MYGYTPQQAAAAAAYGNYSTYAQNTYGQQAQPQSNQIGASGNSSSYNSAGYSYPNAASAYAQYGQTATQQSSNHNAYGQQSSYGQQDYNTTSLNNYNGFSNYASMFKSSATAGYGNIGGRSNNVTTPSNLTGSTTTPTQKSLGVGNNNASNHFAGYEAAVYAAASSYLQAKNTGQTNQWMGSTKRANALSSNKVGKFQNEPYGSNNFSKKRYGLGHQRDVQQHYCEVCKVSCAGQGTYKEHLEGKAHKKKEALSKGENVQSLPRNKVSFKCDVCNVTCTGRDTYDAHAKGVRHQKTVALLKKMNKPIPTLEPTIIPPKDVPNVGVPIPTVGSNASTKKIVGVSGTKFVAGSKLSTANNDALTADAVNTAVEQALLAESNVKPVGEEFIDEQRDASGKLIQYGCKLCDCKFSDPNAKEIHLKGRRHRLQYKAKVNPELKVEIKPQFSRGKNKRDQRQSSGVAPQPLMHPLFQPPLWASLYNNLQNVESNDDRHVLTKCELIQPSKTEMQEIEKLVTLVEKTLKAVSDKFAAENESAQNLQLKDDEKSPMEKERLLKGVMRVGLLAKNLLLKTDKEVDLVVLCSKIPTENLLNEIVSLFPTLLLEEESKVIKITSQKNLSGFYVNLASVPVKCKVTLTCVAIRDPAVAAAGDGTDETATAIVKPADALPVEPCLNALAELRHAKWYQVKCVPLSSINVALKIVRDISTRVKTWMPLSNWAMELLTEKTLSSIQAPLSPGDAVRRIFEVVAGGVILNKKSTLLDPCEKTPTNVLENLTEQEREDITSSAQHALRLISFNQIYKILAIDRLHDIRPQTATNNGDNINGGDRKRLRESNGINADEPTELKKEKKERM